MRYIQIGNKTVAVYSDHYRQRQPIANQYRIRKGNKNKNMNRSRRPFNNANIKQYNPRNETNKNTQNENIPPVNQQQSTTNPSRTPLEKFVEDSQYQKRHLKLTCIDDLSAVTAYVLLEEILLSSMIYHYLFTKQYTQT